MWTGKNTDWLILGGGWQRKGKSDLNIELRRLQWAAEFDESFTTPFERCGPLSWHKAMAISSCFIGPLSALSEKKVKPKSITFDKQCLVWLPYLSLCRALLGTAWGEGKEKRKHNKQKQWHRRETCTYSMLMAHRGNVSGMQLVFSFFFSLVAMQIFPQQPSTSFLRTVEEKGFVQDQQGKAWCVTIVPVNLLLH